MMFLSRVFFPCFLHFSLVSSRSVGGSGSSSQKEEQESSPRFGSSSQKLEQVVSSRNPSSSSTDAGASPNAAGHFENARRRLETFSRHVREPVAVVPRSSHGISEVETAPVSGTVTVPETGAAAGTGAADASSEDDVPIEQPASAPLGTDEERTQQHGEKHLSPEELDICQMVFGLVGTCYACQQAGLTPEDIQKKIAAGENVAEYLANCLRCLILPSQHFVVPVLHHRGGGDKIIPRGRKSISKCLMIWGSSYMRSRGGGHQCRYM